MSWRLARVVLQPRHPTTHNIDVGKANVPLLLVSRQGARLPRAVQTEAHMATDREQWRLEEADALLVCRIEQRRGMVAAPPAGPNAPTAQHKRRDELGPRIVRTRTISYALPATASVDRQLIDGVGLICQRDSASDRGAFAKRCAAEGAE